MHRSAKTVSLAALTAVVLAGLSSAALAHPGHGGGWAGGFAHPFTGLDHMLAMVAVGLWASQLGRPALWILPAVFPVVMALGAIMGANGVAMPWVEIGILASVVVLGAAVALSWQVSLLASAALVGVFALFHGHAHGTEFPAADSPVLYGLGFIAATLILHAIGVGIGLVTRRPVVMRTAGGAIAAVGLLLLVAH
jgi:urease accessory protein